MKLMSFIRVFFLGRRKRPSLFSKVLSEGISDMFAEMGYPAKNKNKEERV